jgi:DNA gyrase subunit A
MGIETLVSEPPEDAFDLIYELCEKYQIKVALHNHPKPSPWVNPGATILTVTENGFGKRSELDEYRLTARGGVGVKTCRVTAKTGPVVGVMQVADDDDLMLITDGGMVIRTRVKGISVMGRDTQGVRLIDLKAGERVVGLARLEERDSPEEEAG